MASFTKPKNLNGKKLIAELEFAGVTVKADETGLKAPWDKADGTIFLNITEADEKIVESIVAAHDEK
jgi:hypothetical protein